MNDPPRRRRSDDDADRGGGLPLFPLVLIVIFAGLLLGGVLAHFVGGSSSAPKAPESLAAVEPTALPTVALPSLAPSAPPLSPKPTPRVKVALSPGAAPTASPTRAAPSPTPSRLPSKPSPIPTPVATGRIVIVASKASVATAAPAAAAPRAAPARAAAIPPAPNYSSSGPNQAAGIVRSYLGALARGDTATATSYLAHGLPGEVFMDSATRIVSVRPSAESNTQYKVAADVQTSSGEYYITFVVEPGAGGLQITDHYAIKVH